MANFTLTANDDTLTGTTGNDFFGTSTIANNRGFDALNGGDGRDTLSVNYTTTTFVSGATYYGNYIYSDGNGGFYGSLAGGSFNYNDGDSGYTSFSNFEVLTIRLSGLADYLYLDAASIGSGATVNIGGGLGTDTLVVDFSTLTGTSFVVAGNGAITSNRGTFSGFEVFNITIGAGTNTVQTQSGNDNVTAYAGGVDTISTGAGNDSIQVYNAVATVDGGTGTDTLTLDQSGSTTDRSFSVTATSGTFDGGGSASNIELFQLTGGSGNDTFNVSGTATGSFSGSGGEDTLTLDLTGLTTPYSNGNSVSSDGAGGFNGYTLGGFQSFGGIEHLNLTLDDSDDFIGVEADSLASGATLNLSGGLGNDTLSIDFRALGDTTFVVAPDGTITSNQGSYSSFEQFTVYVGIGTNLVQTQGGNDSINAYGGGSNTIDTGAGLDYIYAQGGDNHIQAGDGDDTIYTSDAVDVIDGGDGTDTFTAVRDGSSSDQTFNVDGTSANFSDGSVITNIENYNIFGGTGNDLFNVSTNTSGFFNGGGGEDTLYLDLTGTTSPYYYASNIYSNGAGAFSGYTNAGYQSFANIEHVNLTLSDADEFISVDAGPLASGSTLNLSGGLGYDSLAIDFRQVGSTSFSVAADGTITSNQGTYASFEAFTIYLGAGTNSVQTQAGNDSVFAYDGGTNTINTGAGIDYIAAQSGSTNTIDAGADDDTIQTYDSVDTVDGGDGNDYWYVDRQGSSSDLTFTVNGTSASISDGSSATNVEYFNLTSGTGNDTFNVSNNSSGSFQGGGGEDTLTLDLTGAYDNGYYYSSVSSDGAGGFTGYTHDGNQVFNSIEHLNLTLDGADNSIFVDAGSSRSGATLVVDGGAGADTLSVVGNFAGWSINDDGHGGFIFNDIDASDGDYGEFTVKNMEAVQFYDQLYDLTVVHTGQYLVGDVGDDTLTGTAYDDKIDGRGGNDTMTGGDGIDTLSYEFSPGGVKVLLYQVGTSQPTESAGDDTLMDKFENLIGSEYRDRLWGNDLNNHIWGLGGNDYINGMEGNDTMEGGLGDDFYVVDTVGDVIIENAGEGFDTVSTAYSYTLTANVERLQLTGSIADLGGTGNELDNTMSANNFGSTLDGAQGNDLLLGGADVDILIGGEGNDRLDGRGGADFLIGGTGDDTYTTDGLDTITENADEGIDTVSSAATYTLAANLEKLILTGNANINGTGNDLANTLIGNSGANKLFGLDGADKLYGNGGNDILEGGAGNDYLDGGIGTDSMTGGTGNDIYVVERAADIVVENAGEGTDTVNASINYTLGNNLEKLTLTGSANLKGDGNAAGNVITGNSGDNVIYAYAGADNLIGGEGSDILTGGLGRDTLNGGAGVDYFRFDVLDTSVNRDTIVDFVHGTDQIWLSGTAFTALVGSPISLTLGTGATTATDHVIYDQSTGVLSYDADGNGSGAAVQIAVLTAKPFLDAGDLLLVA